MPPKRLWPENGRSAKGSRFDLSNGLEQMCEHSCGIRLQRLERQLKGGDQAGRADRGLHRTSAALTSPTVDIVALDDPPRASTNSNCQATD